jgi:hypothetical protein
MNNRVSAGVLIGMFLLGPAGTLPQDPAGRPQLDRSKPVPAKADVIAAWRQRQDAIRTFQFAWTEEQSHPAGWLPNPRNPERERSAVPALRTDRRYSVAKTLAVDAGMMRYTFQLDRNERHYSYVSVFDGERGETRLTSLTGSPPAAVHRTGTNVDAQNLDTRPILLAFRPLDSLMGHARLDRAVTNEARTFYRGRSTFLLEERHDPSGWKTVLWIEPERDFLVSRFAILFEQQWMVDMDVDYKQDPRWGWIPSGWRVTEMLGDGTRRLISTATVSSYSINLPIGIEQFRSSV